MERRVVVLGVVTVLAACATTGSGSDGVQRTTVVEEVSGDEVARLKKAEVESQLKARIAAESSLIKALGTTGDSELVDVLGSGELDSQALGELMGSSGVVVGSGGLGMKGSGLGGGGSASGIGGLGTKGAGVGGGGRVGYGRRTASRVKVKVKQAALRVSGPGTIDEGHVKRVMRRRQSALQYCVEKAEVKDPSPRAKGQKGARYELSVALEVNEQGRVTQVRALKGDLKKAPTECVTRMLKRMRFPKPVGGAAQVEVDLAIDVEHPDKDEAKSP